MPIASTTGKPSTNRTTNARTTRNPSIADQALGEHRLLLFGTAAMPSVRQHHQCLDHQQHRADRQWTHEEPEWQLHDCRLVLQIVADRDYRRDEQYGEESCAGQLDHELQVPAWPRRYDRLKFLHADLPALLGDIARREERH